MVMSNLSSSTTNIFDLLSLVPGKCIDAEQLAEIASLVEVDESKPRLFVLGGRNLHGHVYDEGWGAPWVCIVPIPSVNP